MPNGSGCIYEPSQKNMGQNMKQELQINGVIYAVEVHQNNSSLPWLLMLHGFMGDGRTFHHLAEGLSEACNPITVDLLGHGESEKIDDANRYNEKHQVADIISIVQQLGVTPVFLYGYSMGGRLAFKTALEAPALVKGLILESTTYGIIDNQERAERRKVDARRAQKIKEDYEGFLSKWEELALFESPIDIDEQLSIQYKKIHLDQDPGAMSASLIGFGTGAMQPIRDNVTGFNKPALVLAGSADEKYIAISCSLGSYFDNVHVCHIKAGHRIHVDNPNKLIQEINFFIDQNSLL
ncbi:MAG: 2-succinyl-6-hydroxy-2,4-cyclohexadiene-1-carboxylate synthase [Balneolaceae bacterium]|nr:2-succinyl-6-hydroxy-2,4-cyclohexadiene-1-carboxylate synthase [Balneolaceae bacterium]